MRLTDILREKDKKQSAKMTDGHSRKDLAQQKLRAEAERNETSHSTGHLSVGDLGAIYNLDAPSGQPRDAADENGVQTNRAQAPTHSDAPRDNGVKTQPTDGSGGSPQNQSNGDENSVRQARPSFSEKETTDEDEEYEHMEDQEYADAVHIETLSLLEEFYQQSTTEPITGVERLITPLSRIIEACRNSNVLLRKAIRLKRGGRSFTSHSLNVAILAIKIGITREFADERLFSLGMCAFLGDIGMTRVDPEILKKTTKLVPEEIAEIRRHLDKSADILAGVSKTFPFITPIILQHHERSNGSGYPRGMKGENIHEFAKIIGMCDVYIAMTEPKANRENFSGYVALQQIISRRGIDFDPKIIKSLIDVLSVFPLESLIRLNNGAICRVVDISSVHPTRPRLLVIINSDGEKLTKPRLLDLEKEPLLYVEDPDIEEGVVL